MPRVKLGTPTPAQQRAVMNKIIKKAMVDCDIEDYTALGLRMGMSRQAISRRMNDEFTITQEGGIYHAARLPICAPIGPSDDPTHAGASGGASGRESGEL